MDTKWASITPKPEAIYSRRQTKKQREAPLFDSKRSWWVIWRRSRRISLIQSSFRKTGVRKRPAAIAKISYGSITGASAWRADEMGLKSKFYAFPAPQNSPQFFSSSQGLLLRSFPQTLSFLTGKNKFPFVSHQPVCTRNLRPSSWPFQYGSHHST